MESLIKKFTREQRRAKIWELRLRGQDIATIARTVHLEYGQCQLILNTLYKEHAAELAEEMKHHAKADVDRTNKMLDALQPRIEEGDEKAVAVAAKLLDHRAKLLGTYEATKVIVKNEEDAGEVRRQLMEALKIEKPAEG